MPMFEGVAGTTAVTLTANRTAAAAPMPTWVSRPSAANSAQQESSCSNQAPSWATAATEPRRGSRKTTSPVRTCFRALRIEARPGPTRPSPLVRTSDGASSTATSSSSGAIETRKSFSVLRWKRSVVLTMITPSISEGERC